MKVDLHIHTTASDGTWTPEILIKKIVSEGIRIFAVTDHDTFSNIDQVTRQVQGTALSFVPGVEISTTYSNGNYHILGYGIDTESDPLKTLLAKNKSSSAKGQIENIEFLSKKGCPVSSKEFIDYTYDLKRGGWKELTYLIDKGYCQTHIDYLTFYKKMNIQPKFEYGLPENAIQSILLSGGIPILAHPGSPMYKTHYKETVSLMMEMGIKGIECFHPENSMEVTTYCVDFCKKNNLFSTGGSDCHGDFVKTRSLGTPDVLLEQINLGTLLVKE